MAMADSLDHVGPMARSVADVAIMFDAIAGRDPKDPTSLEAPAPLTFKDLTEGIRGLRIGVDRDYALKGIDGGQAAAIDRALQVLSGLGATIVDVRMPDLSGVLEMWSTSCDRRLRRRTRRPTHRASEYGPYMREFVATGARVTPQQLTAARERRKAFNGTFTALLESVDAIAGPSGGDPAWPITHAIQVGSLPEYHKAWSAASPRSAEFTMPMDLAGVPAICLPCGFSSDGLPYSIQFTGRRLAEATLCRIAYAYEQATAWHARHPTLKTA
jgi:amidase